MDFWWHFVLGFKARVDPPCVHASSPACNGILRFTYGATFANLLMAKHGIQAFLIHVLLHIKKH